MISMNETLAANDKSFDFVLSHKILERVESQKFYLDQSYLVLKGNVIPILSKLAYWQYHTSPTDYWRWSSAELKKISSEARFAIESLLDKTLQNVTKSFKEFYSLIFQMVMRMTDKHAENKFYENLSVFIFS